MTNLQIRLFTRASILDERWGYIMMEDLNQDSKGEYGRDFFTGCFALVIIFVTIFILVPFAIFFLKLSLFLVIPVAAIILIIILTKFFGRVINEFFRRNRDRDS